MKQNGNSAAQQRRSGRQGQDEPVGSIREAYAGELMPPLQVSTFRNTHRIFPTRTVRRGSTVRDLPPAQRQLENFPIRSRGADFDFFDYVSRNRVAGLLILKDGETAFEHYDFGIDADTRWMSMSMAKSVSTTLVGAAIRDGYIGSVDDQLVHYLPELEGSAYDGVSIRNLLQMTSGVHWDDTHTDPASERRHMLELQIAQEHSSILNFMRTLPRAAEPGTRWNYSTGETHVVGALVRAAVGQWLADYFSERIWSKIGTEADAEWWLEAPGGLEVAGSGLCATLRDYARFGLFMLEGGLADGRPVMPDSWIDEACSPRMIGGERLDYGYMWWPIAGADGSFAQKAYSARGIFGQYIYINPAERIVITVLSARSKPKFAEAVLDNDFFNCATEALG